jgi:hypothetical protein
MDEKVRQLHAVAPIRVSDEIRAEVVAKLERALTTAKAGDISEIVILALHPDDEYSQLTSSTMSMTRWIGIMTITVSDWIAQHRKNKS